MFLHAVCAWVVAVGVNIWGKEPGRREIHETEILGKGPGWVHVRESLMASSRAHGFSKVLVEAGTRLSSGLRFDPGEAICLQWARISGDCSSPASLHAHRVALLAGGGLNAQDEAAEGHLGQKPSGARAFPYPIQNTQHCREQEGGQLVRAPRQRNSGRFECESIPSSLLVRWIIK